MNATSTHLSGPIQESVAADARRLCSIGFLQSEPPYVGCYNSAFPRFSNPACGRIAGRESLLSVEAGADEVADHRQLFFAGDGVGLGELVPLDLDSCRSQAIDLLPHRAKRNQRIVRPVRDEKTLLQRHR